MSVGGLAVGVLALAGLAVGLLAVGGLALGGLVAGGAAVAWSAAFGGLAVARDVAVGGEAFAAHANDAFAEAQIASHPFFRTARIVLDYSIVLVFLPVLLGVVAWIRARRGPTRAG